MRPPPYMILIILTNLAVHIHGINRLAAECEPDDVIADIAGPCRDQGSEPPALVRVQRARGLLEVRQVAGRSRHEMICRVARGAAAILVAIGAARCIDQLSQADRRAAGL